MSINPYANDQGFITLCTQVKTRYVPMYKHKQQKNISTYEFLQSVTKLRVEGEFAINYGVRTYVYIYGNHI